MLLVTIFKLGTTTTTTTTIKFIILIQHRKGNINAAQTVTGDSMKQSESTTPSTTNTIETIAIRDSTNQIRFTDILQLGAVPICNNKVTFNTSKTRPEYRAVRRFTKTRADCDNKFLTFLLPGTAGLCTTARIRLFLPLYRQRLFIYIASSVVRYKSCSKLLSLN